MIFSSKLNLQWVGKISNFHKFPRLPEGKNPSYPDPSGPRSPGQWPTLLGSETCWNSAAVSNLGHVSHSVLHVTCLERQKHPKTPFVSWPSANFLPSSSSTAQLPISSHRSGPWGQGRCCPSCRSMNPWTIGWRSLGAADGRKNGTGLRCSFTPTLCWGETGSYLEFLGVESRNSCWFFMFERVWSFCAENRRVDIAFWNPSWLAVRLVCPRSGGIRLT